MSCLLQEPFPNHLADSRIRACKVSFSAKTFSFPSFQRFVQFRYDLGSGVGKGQSTSRVTLNQWHVVTANRSSQTGSLQLDGGNVVPVLSPSRAIGLDVQSDFYLGGVPQLSSVSPRAVENTNDLKDYSGCISEFKVMMAVID